jgi:Ca2+:H+ antiporter
MSSKPRATNASESTPLLNGESASSNGNQNHIQSDSQHGRSDAFKFFLDSKHTPGIHSENIAVRSLAYTWHVTKVTMLSSKFGPIGSRYIIIY